MSGVNNRTHIPEPITVTVLVTFGNPKGTLNGLNPLRTELRLKCLTLSPVATGLTRHWHELMDWPEIMMSDKDQMMSVG